MTELLWLVPTRTRPERAAELLQAHLEHTDGSSDLLFILDADPDPQAYLEALRAVAGDLPLNKDRQRLPGTLNAWGPEMAKTIPYIGHMGDDHRPRTKGYDGMMLAALKEKGGVVYGDDGFQHEALATSVALDSRIISTLGFMCPSTTHYYADNFWVELGHNIGRLTYMPEVSIEHLHPLAGKHESDDLYDETAKAFDADTLIWQSYLQEYFPADVATVRAIYD